MTQHASLNAERWSAFSVDQQVLMIANELLRWRDLIAELYIAGHGNPTAHRAAFRALLQLRPHAARQIPLLLG